MVSQSFNVLYNFVYKQLWIGVRIVQRFRCFWNFLYLALTLKIEHTCWSPIRLRLGWYIFDISKSYWRCLEKLSWHLEKLTDFSGTKIQWNVWITSKMPLIINVRKMIGLLRLIKKRTSQIKDQGYFVHSRNEETLKNMSKKKKDTLLKSWFCHTIKEMSMGWIRSPDK